jgi:Ca-activated chloride channel homolog
MADAFRMRWKLDQPYLLADRPEEVYALIAIEPNPQALAEGGNCGLPTHLFVLVDVSGSMDYLMRHDPSATTIGKQVTEGRAAVSVVSTVPSRRETAALVVDRLISQLEPDDRVTLIAFDHEAYILAAGLAPTQRGEIEKALKQLQAIGGGGTVVANAFEAVQRLLGRQPEPERTCKLVLLTDGEDDEVDRARLIAHALATDFRTPLTAFGMGECKVAFLAELARLTLAGNFNHVRDEKDAEQFFQQAVLSQKNVIATNAVLKLWLSPEMHVRDFYRTRPEILYVGDVLPDSTHMVNLPLQQMEKGKAYEFLFRCLPPNKAPGQRFRLAKATLTYDLPAQQLVGATHEANIVVEFTASEEQARQRSGDVRRTLARAEVQRQVLFLQAKIDALRSTPGDGRDRSLVAKMLDSLVRRFEELGDTAGANQYRTLQAEFTRSGTISQEMLNRSLAASSRAEEVVVAQDIDF